MQKKQLKSKPQTVGIWLIDKVNTKDYRAGKLNGKKHPKRQEMLDAIGTTIGRKQMIRQIAELEREGIIEVIWTSVNTDFKGIVFPIENMDALCKYEGVVNPKRQLEEVKEKVLMNLKQTTIIWLKKYYQELLKQLESGTIPENAQDENVFQLLNAVSVLERDVWKRKFSADVLNDSKLFEKSYKNRIVTILKKYSSKVIDEMTDDEVLAEHHIASYSQTLEYKGAICYAIKNKEYPSQQTVVDTTNLFYGTVLNAQTLINAIPLSLKRVKKIITIENKANYEDMSYDSETLYIYVHGFLSPKERTFLIKMRDLADETVEFYHWSDLDYGGIRIFQFMKKEVFPKIKPLNMDRITYEKALQKGSGISIDARKIEKLQEIDAGELEELKQCILQYKVEIEQESI